MAQMRMRQSMAQIELAFEQEMALEKRRREQLRKRAANRSRARRIQRTESKGKVRFSVLLVALTITVLTVVVVMFEVARLADGLAGRPRPRPADSLQRDALCVTPPELRSTVPLPLPPESPSSAWMRSSTSSRKIETSRGAVMPRRTFAPATERT